MIFVIIICNIMGLSIKHLLQHEFLGCKKRYLKNFLFITHTHIKKTEIKGLENIDLLPELPFYEEFSVIETDQAFKRYAMSYEVESIDRNDTIAQLEASKFSINDLFFDFLNKTKSFKYQVKV